jgi:hypothetical protein
VGVLALAVVVAACVSQPAREPLPAGDPEAFAAAVQPVLDARCSDPSCHGRPERPLSIYSPLRYRMDPARRFLSEPLTAAELLANQRSVEAFALASREAGQAASACLVACKPLAAAAGGCGHDGGAIFASRDDREYRALEGWLATLMEAP